MRLKSAEYRQEKGQNKSAVAGWVGGFPCRGQEAPQSALRRIVEELLARVKVVNQNEHPRTLGTDGPMAMPLNSYR